MEFKGSDAYEEQDFLKNYLNRRSRPDSPNNAIEGPIIDRLLKVVGNARILDLGSGDGHYGKELISRGANTYTGVEGSSAMVNLALKNATGQQIDFVKCSIENFNTPDKVYDIVVSRMAIHYVEDLGKLFRSISRALGDRGQFIFSVQHPLTTSSFKSKSSSEKKGSWVVDDYFHQGIRQEPWMGKSVVKYHRTIESYFSELVSAGFQIEALEEGEPRKENFVDEHEFERRKRIPIVLVFSCKKADR